jgi:predicted O-methyltransferase YrrM
MADRAKYIPLSPKLYEYLVAHGHNNDPIRAELAAETEKLGTISMMQIAPEQGTFMAMLAAAIGARSCVEVGTFTGYSSLCVARALPSDAKMLCCDVNEQWTAVAKKYWARAGVAEKITLRLAPALDTLRALPANYPIDYAFIDADKTNYRNYYEEILKRIRRNGLMLIDNVLWNGEVINSSNTNEDTVAIRVLNDFIATDQRVEAVMIGAFDGLTIVRKR